MPRSDSCAHASFCVTTGAAAPSDEAHDGGDQLAEGQATDQARDHHRQPPVGQHREARLLGVRAREPAGAHRLDEHPAGEGRTDRSRQDDGGTERVEGEPPDGQGTDEQGQPVRRQASAVRSCGAVGSDAGRDDPASGRSATGEAGDAQHDRRHRDRRRTTSIAGLLGSACPSRIARSVRDQPRQAAPAVSSPASAKHRRGGSAPCRSAERQRVDGRRAGDERQRVRIQARKVRSLASENARVGLLPWA